MSHSFTFQHAEVEKFISLSQEYWCVLGRDGELMTSNAALRELLAPEEYGSLGSIVSKKEEQDFRKVLDKAFETGKRIEYTGNFIIRGHKEKLHWKFITDDERERLYCVGTHVERSQEEENNKLNEAFDQLRLTLNNNKFSQNELSDIQNVLSDKIDKFKLISQNVSDIVCLHEPNEARYLYVSPSLKEVTGYEPEEFVGKSPYDFFHPDMLKLLEEDHKKKQQGEDVDEGPPPKMLYKISGKAGNYIWLESHSRPIFDEAGNVIMILSTSRDVTERVDAEQEKEKYFEYYRILANNIPNGAVFLIDKDYRFVIAEGQEFKKIGRTPQFYLGKTIYEVYDKDRLEFLKPYFEGVLESKKKVKFEYQHKGYDYTFWGTPYVDDDGQIVCGIFLTQNITEAKQLERQLRDTIHELEFQKLALDSSALVSISNTDNIITYVNKRFCKISGFSRKELIGNKLSVLNSDYHPRQFFENMRSTMRKGKVWHGEIRNKAKSGDLFWVDTYIIPFKNESGEVVKFVYIRFDITDRKKAEEDLKAKNYELDAFAYHTSHDLRAPLSSIIGLTTLIDNEADMEAIKYYNSLVQNRIEKLDEFIRAVMTHSQNKNLELTIEKIDFQDLVQNAIKEVQFNGHYSQIKVDKEIDTKGNFYTDRVRLSIILSNLIVNGMKYANPHKADACLKIQIKANKEKASISIEDNGIGIRKKYISKVFDMFYRANERVEGSGLGLYIVKQTVDKLKGKIEIHSQYGEGTNVLITLPNLKG